jgi:predicted transcriptional regulator
MMMKSSSTLVSVRLPSAVAKRLKALAARTARSNSYLAAQAIEEFLTLQEWQVKAIQLGLKQADAGKLRPHDEALSRLSRWKRRGH